MALVKDYDDNCDDDHHGLVKNYENYDDCGQSGPLDNENDENFDYVDEDYDDYGHDCGQVPERPP